jgi:hypothetical protein
LVGMHWEGAGNFVAGLDWHCFAILARHIHCLERFSRK